MSSELLTVADAAVRMSLSAATIRRLIASKELDHCRFGRAIRIPAEAVSRAIKAAKSD